MLSEDVDQENILNDDAPRLLITAPPGSGKTVTAIRIAQRDIELGRVGPTQRILLLTFSLHARAQLESYAAKMLTPEQRGLIEITNYHAWFWAKVNQFRSSLGMPHELELSTERQHRDDVLGAMIEEGVVDPGAIWADPAPDYSVVLEHSVDSCRPERLPDPLARAREVGQRLVAIHKGGRLHYDDLAFYMWRLVSESATLRQIWRHKYPVVILDEYQDASPIQDKIVESIVGEEGRVYAFADPLQMIYGWRDASPLRVAEFEARDASSHELKTLHRYSHRPSFRRWMEGARDVLLGDRDDPLTLPAEVSKVLYDPTNRVRNEPWDIASRDLWQLNSVISQAFGSGDIRSIAVLHRKHSHLERVERSLSANFYCKRLRTARETSEWARDWVEAATTVANEQAKMELLFEVALRVSPRNEDLIELSKRIDSDGIRTNRLGSRRRELATALNNSLTSWADLAGACESARCVAQISARHEDPKLVAKDAVHVIRTSLRVRRDLNDEEARQRILNRLAQLRFTSEGREPRGLFLLTCHEAKGKEFDMVVLPYVSNEIFRDDDQEDRQLLYVALTRARHRIFMRLAEGKIPQVCRSMGLAA